MAPIIFFRKKHYVCFCLINRMVSEIAGHLHIQNFTIQLRQKISFTNSCHFYCGNNFKLPNFEIYFIQNLWNNSWKVKKLRESFTQLLFKVMMIYYLTKILR